MTVKSHYRGNEIIYSQDKKMWYFTSNNSPVPDNKDMPCGRCGEPMTKEGHDNCLGELDGLANACCGHGDTSQAYIQFLDGTSISGNDAIAIQEILKRNKGNSTKLEKLIFLAGSCKFKAQEIEEKERMNE